MAGSNRNGPARVGLVGCGYISGAYLGASRKFDTIEITACADILEERARARAEEFGIPKVSDVEGIFEDPDLDIVLNLTLPATHAELQVRALQSGKHVYTEKPLALTRADGERVVRLGRDTGLRVGCAPDTFLGAGIQTCRKVIDEGLIGEPVAANAFMMSHGHEHWHPDPAFYYKVGGGPMFDMGPYYLTALVALMGPVRRVAGATRVTFPEREISSAPKRGQKIKVEVPTHIASLLQFETGAIATLVTSFDVWDSELPRMEIYGTRGTLSVPDPNTFGGPVRVKLAGDSEWREVPLASAHIDQNRGIGLADMAHAIQHGRPHRASGDMAYHVLDLMQAFHESSEQEVYIDITSTCDRPEPLPEQGF